MHGVWKDARRPNHPKGAFAKLQSSSICSDHFCLFECVVSETTRLIVMQFNILLFLKVCRKNSSFFQMWEGTLAIYVKAYCIYYNISSVLLNIKMFRTHFVQKSRTTLFCQVSSKHCHISNNVNDTAEWDKPQMKIYHGACALRAAYQRV